MLNKISFFFGSWFYLGKAKYASGTFGTLGALPFAWFILQYFGMTGLIIASIVVSILGIFISDNISKNMGIKDPGVIVIDEVAGVFISLIPAMLTPMSFIIGFALFRLFDISKPWPVSWADKKVEGGLGVMLDDIIAGIIGAAILYFLQIQFPEFFKLI